MIFVNGSTVYFIDKDIKYLPFALMAALIGNQLSETNPDFLQVLGGC